MYITVVYHDDRDGIDNGTSGILFGSHMSASIDFKVGRHGAAQFIQRFQKLGKDELQNSRDSSMTTDFDKTKCNCKLI